MKQQNKYSMGQWIVLIFVLGLSINDSFAGTHSSGGGSSRSSSSSSSHSYSSGGSHSSSSYSSGSSSHSSSSSYSSSSSSHSSSSSYSSSPSSSRSSSSSYSSSPNYSSSPSRSSTPSSSNYGSSPASRPSTSSSTYSGGSTFGGSSSSSKKSDSSSVPKSYTSGSHNYGSGSPSSSTPKSQTTSSVTSSSTSSKPQTSSGFSVAPSTFDSAAASAQKKAASAKAYSTYSSANVDTPKQAPIQAPRSSAARTSAHSAATGWADSGRSGNVSKPRASKVITPTNDGGRIEQQGNSYRRFRPDGSLEERRTATKAYVYRKDGTIAQTRSTTSLGTVVTNHNPDGSNDVYALGVKQYSYNENIILSGSSRTSHRTYVYDNVSVVRDYQIITRNRYSYNVYVPTPIASFDYGFFSIGWATPVDYTWGWEGAPWYGSYNYYFQPRRHYLRASDILVDSLVSGYLSSRYDYQLAAAREREQQANIEIENADRIIRNYEQTHMQDSMMTQISVQAQEVLNDHRKGQTENIEDLLRNPSYVYLVSDPRQLSIVGSDNLCEVTPGDALQLFGDVDLDEGSASMEVVSSQVGDCPLHVHVNVSLSDLQEFHNRFVQNIMEKDALRILKERSSFRR